jgi:hypothetical protein
MMTSSIINAKQAFGVDAATAPHVPHSRPWCNLQRKSGIRPWCRNVLGAALVTNGPHRTLVDAAAKVDSELYVSGS